MAPRLEDFVNAQGTRDGLRITDFVQREPNDGAPATLHTTVYLSYDANHLYAVFVCEEEARSLRAHVSRREDIEDDDRVSIALDTFHDGRRAYAFFVNPLGVQREGIIAEGQDDDFSFDTVWRSEARLTANGYMVLMAIPFKSLRFDPRAGRTWGIALGRYSPATKEFSTWPHLSEKVEAYVPQFATMAAVESATHGHDVQLIPYAFFSGQRFLDTSTELPAFKSQNEFRAGLDGKLVLRDALTFDFTANPDFSQVESDEPQVTVNQRYEVFFPEKRPFFTEGAGFFQTPENLFFSRHVVDPQFGMRMTGKVGRWAMGLLTADDRAPALSDPELADRAKIGVFRLQRELGKESMFGVFLSRRSFGPTSNQLMSIDARWKLNPNWVFTGQAAHSSTRDLDGNRVSGNDFFAEIRHTGLHVSSYTQYLDRSPRFEADLGFIPRVDLRQLKNVTGYRWRPEQSSLVSFGPSLYTRALWDHTGQLQEWVVDPSFSWQFKGPTSISAGHLEEFEKFETLGFRENASYVSLSTQRLRWMGVDLEYSHGADINFFPAAGTLPSLRTSDDVSVGITLRPNSRIRIDETYIYDRLGKLASTDIPSGTVFNNHLFRTKINYQFNRALSVRAIVDYNATLPDSSVVDLERSKRITTDVLVTYLLHPGTAIYAGYSNQRENLAFVPGASILRSTSPGLTTERQFFIKMSYLLRF
ncbi:MAG TPA: DUF5916 domain-containing protein [Terriglobales bacterium]|nr:DUF5916 domain-containing protein [Terriglobales bacterium]